MATTLPTRPPARRGSQAKFWLWMLLFLLSLSVLIYTELPFLNPENPLHAHHVMLGWLLGAHALAGLLALLIGPAQFSSRLRLLWPRTHRILGRVYVGSVFVAAPLAIAMATVSHSAFIVGTWTQSTVWVAATLAALFTARNRHFPQHRQWMIRSYAVTFTFIALRVPNPWPAWANMPDQPFTVIIVIATLLAVLLPDIAFHWREITRRRA